MKRGVGLLSLLGFTAAWAPASAPASQELALARGTVPMKISGRIGRATFEEKVAGECATHAASSIYDMPATQWRAAFGGADNSNIQHLNLTIWQPRSGAPEMVNLSFRSGEIDHSIATVKGGTIEGSATAQVRAAGKGGILTVNGKDGDGHPLELTVECERFDEVVAEGG